jgi:NAD(P)-dependent dehydrogenase (short-subunit alcohol dehydrogenase family)
MTSINNATFLVTGANRGIGRALVDEALGRGAARVYAGTRQPLTHLDKRVTPVRLDVTDDEQIQALLQQVERLDVLVNNAGLARYDDLSDRAVIQMHLDVNLFGSYAVTQALLPHVIRSHGTVVNVLSVGALAAIPVLPAYSISKSAVLSLTQSLRALLAGHDIRVQAVLTGPVDTDMSRDLDLPKASAASVARAILDGVESDADEIFPDPMSAEFEQSWHSSAAKVLERANAELLAAQAVA